MARKDVPRFAIGGATARGRSPFLDTAVYHCQQAAEKALKAYLSFHDTPFQKFHDLSMLLEECRVFDAAFEQLREHAETLTPYGTAFRYPGEAEDPESAEAKEAVRLAEAVLDFVRTRIPDDKGKNIHE